MLLIGREIVSERRWWGWLVAGDDLWYYTEKQNTLFCKVGELPERVLKFLLSRNVEVTNAAEFESNAAWAISKSEELL